MLVAIQTEDLLETVLITIQKHVSNGLLITVHKSQTINEWLYHKNRLTMYSIKIKTLQGICSSVVGHINIKKHSKIEKRYQILLMHPSSDVLL